MLDKQIIDELSKFIAIKSISTDKKYKNEIKKAVGFLKSILTTRGFKVKTVYYKSANPLVCAYYDNNCDRTIGIYGHYDVQPIDKDENWSTKDPFTLEELKGKYIARGIADNKGHIIQNIEALSQLIHEKKLVSNIILLFEGEEEIGSFSFEKLIGRIKHKVKEISAFYITDTGMRNKYTPQIFYGLRGIVGFELTVKTGRKDLHSGIYGNRVYNASEVISHIISRLKDVEANKVLIPCFYNDVKVPNEHEEALLMKILKSDKQEQEEAGVYCLRTIDKVPTSLASKIYPSLDINTIFSGYMGEGSKSSIPYKATLKATCRLVPNQKTKDIKISIADYIKKIMPDGVLYNLEFHGLCDPFHTNTNNEYVKKTIKILNKSFSNKTVFNRSGGSIPAATILQNTFGKPVIVCGFTPPDDNIHSADENYDSEMFRKGIEVFKKIYSE